MDHPAESNFVSLKHPRCPVKYGTFTHHIGGEESGARLE